MGELLTQGVAPTSVEAMVRALADAAPGTRRRAALPRGAGNSLTGALFSPDGQSLVTTCIDGTMRRYPCDFGGAPAALLARARITRAFTPAERIIYLHQGTAAGA